MEGNESLKSLYYKGTDKEMSVWFIADVSNWY